MGFIRARCAISMSDIFVLVVMNMQRDHPETAVVESPGVADPTGHAIVRGAVPDCSRCDLTDHRACFRRSCDGGVRASDKAIISTTLNVG